MIIKIILLIIFCIILVIKDVEYVKTGQKDSVEILAICICIGLIIGSFLR